MKTDFSSDKLQILQRQLMVIFLFLACLFLTLQVGAYFADVFRILFGALLISYLFVSIVDKLEKILRVRIVAVLIVYLVVGVATILAAVVVVPAMIAQVSQLVESSVDAFPQLIQYLVGLLTPLEHKLHAAQIQVRAIDLLSSVAAGIPRPDPSIIISRITDVAMSTMTWVLYGLSIAVLSFYFLLDGRRIKDGVISAFPKKFHGRLQAMAVETDISLQSFFRGQIILGVIFGFGMMLVFIGLGMHYALLLGVVLAIMEIIPVVGPPMGQIPAFVAVAISGMDHVPLDRWGQILLLFVILQAFQWVKDNVVGPRYIGNVIGLHPMMIFIAIMIGARIDGAVGIIYSLPIACVANVILHNLRREPEEPKSPVSLEPTADV